MKNTIYYVDGVRVYLDQKERPISTLIDVCDELAQSLECEFELRVYSDYRWMQGAFLVDRFGGLAVLFRYRFEFGKWELAGEHGTYIPYNSLAELLAVVPDAVRAEWEARENVESVNCD